MTDLSPSQLRAARALLNWSRTDLASRADVSEQTLHRFENETHAPSPQTRQKLVRTLENAGIALMEDSGVKFKINNIEVYEGRERFKQFYDFIYEHSRLHGGTICVGGVDERLYTKSQGDFAQYHMNRMSALAQKRNSFKMKILVQEGDTHFIATQYAEYRWQEKDSFPPTSFYAFGECLALISFVHDPSPYVVLHRSGPFAEAYRRSFEIAWEKAKIPPKKDLHKASLNAMEKHQNNKKPS